MRIYLVGGAVRDSLLGRDSADRDFVVVGATPEQMLREGYRPIGKDFADGLANLKTAAEK